MIFFVLARIVLCEKAFRLIGFKDRVREVFDIDRGEAFIRARMKLEAKYPVLFHTAPEAL